MLDPHPPDATELVFWLIIVALAFAVAIAQLI